MADDNDSTCNEFRDTVNMTAGEEKWLETAESNWRYSLMNWGHEACKSS